MVKFECEPSARLITPDGNYKFSNHINDILIEVIESEDDLKIKIELSLVYKDLINDQNEIKISYTSIPINNFNTFNFEKLSTYIG